MKQTYLTFDYENFTGKGLKQVIKAFEHEKVPILKDGNDYNIEATNKQRRVRGMPTKSATLYFEDGQSLTLLVSNEGSIYQVKLNNRVIPVRNVDNLKKAVAEIAGMIKGNSNSFARNLARQVKRKHREDGEGRKKAISNSIPARLKSINIILSEAKKDLDGSQSKVAEKKDSHLAKIADVSRLEGDLRKEQSRNVDLLSQIKTLKAA